MVKGITETITAIIIFLVLYGIGKFIMNKIKKHENKFTNNRLLNPTEYMPKEEVETLKQVSYLIVLFLIFIFFLYSIIPMANIEFFSILEIIFMVYIALNQDYTDWKSKLFFFFIIPYGSMTHLIFIRETISILDIFHTIILIYFMKVYYDKFRKYTETNGLGITILLLFSIIFISFIFTMIVEGASPIDSIAMVSNAFTSNGYAVLGSTLGGKLNSILLVWSGYILSGVGTATMTVALLSKHFNKRIKENEKTHEAQYTELKEMIERNNAEIKEILKENNLEKKTEKELEKKIIEP